MIKMTINIDGVSKRFGATKALDNVTLRLEEGHIYGLLGNNGAGKTTLLSIMTDRLFPDAGAVTLDGAGICDNDAALSKIFFCGEANFFPEDLKVRQAFKAAESFYPGFDKAYAEALVKKFGLDTKKKITALSTGYASIFRLILALSVNTPWLLLDEPVLGLDAQHRDMFYEELIKKFSAGETTVVLSTHLISEVDGIVDQAIIIREGSIIENAPTEALLMDLYTVSGPAAVVDAYAEGRPVIDVKTLGGLKTAAIRDRRPEGGAPAGLEFGTIGLQEYFVSLMNAEDERE